ncbi:hypothetical protein ACS0TY_018787 [Phlomoides rotata]
MRRIISPILPKKVSRICRFKPVPGAPSGRFCAGHQLGNIGDHQHSFEGLFEGYI